MAPCSCQRHHRRRRVLLKRPFGRSRPLALISGITSAQPRLQGKNVASGRLVSGPRRLPRYWPLSAGGRYLSKECACISSHCTKSSSQMILPPLLNRFITSMYRLPPLHLAQMLLSERGATLKSFARSDDSCNGIPDHRIKLLYKTLISALFFTSSVASVTQCNLWLFWRPRDRKGHHRATMRVTA